jgi:UDP-N-acetylmuramoyl-tripeptide--D-alanyl-D-alanine ligase
VLVTEASQNGFQGVPTTLLRLRREHNAAVIEVGIDEPDSMIQHLELVQPTAGLLTSIGPEHLEKLIDLDTVEEEEGMLFTVLEARRGLAAVNLDDERIARQAEQLEKARVLSYSLVDPKATIRGCVVAGELLVEGLGAFPLPLEGSHNARNLLGAVALARGLGLTGDEMRTGLATFRAPPGRSEVHEWRGCRVLVDTYNANPSSVEAAFETMGSGARSWVCLGDMLELGKFEEPMHRDLAEPILARGVAHVLLFGPRMKFLEAELRSRGFSGELRHFGSQEEMAAHLAAGVRAGDVILLKGSRGMKMEKVWESLRGK